MPREVEYLHDPTQYLSNRGFLVARVLGHRLGHRIGMARISRAGGEWNHQREDCHEVAGRDQGAADRAAWDAFGSFAVSGDKAFIFEQTSDHSEACGAWTRKTGKELWSTKIDHTIRDRQGGDGPRSRHRSTGTKCTCRETYLKLACLNAADGKIVWSHDLVAEFGGGDHQWGNAASPLVEGDLVIVAGGGRGQSIIGFKKETGEVAWKKLDEKITHATATPATIEGVHQDIFFMQSGLVSIAPATGEMLWKQPFPYSVSTAASPVVEKNVVYCSAGYGVGAGAYRVTKNGDKFTSTEIWRLKGGDVNHWSTPVIRDGFVYGLFGFKEFGRMPLKCVELPPARSAGASPASARAAW